jgi:uncharacterized protein (TIGR01777 family)
MTKKPILVIAGASGVVGQHILKHAAPGWELRVLTRRASASFPQGEAFVWDPARAAQQEAHAVKDVARALEGATALINLAGASINGSFDEEHKRAVLQSRLEATQALAHGWSAAQAPPPTWLQASAVGYYGDTGDREIQEGHAPGQDFLASVCVQWEQAAASFAQEQPGLRLAIGRIGLVLSREAEAWKKMLTPIKLGAGGPLGDGEQFYAWVHADDLARAWLFLAREAGCRGAFNLTAPAPIRQKELASRAASRLHRPSFLPAPKFALRLVLGEMADALLLTSCRAVPANLLEAGFSFERPDFGAALDELLS